MKTYLRQNTHHHDAINTITSLYKRLLARGHSPENLRLVFMDAASKLSKINSNNSGKKVKRIKKAKSQLSLSKVFLHLPFHPQDISRKEIQKIYSDTCESPHASFHRVYNSANEASMNINGIVVAYSRAKNLRDELNPTTLFETKNIAVDLFAKKINH